MTTHRSQVGLLGHRQGGRTSGCPALRFARWLQATLCVWSLLLVLFGFTGCTRWKVKSVTTGHHVPQSVYLYVAVSEQVAFAEDYGAVPLLVETIEADLRDEGIRTELVAAHGGEPPPLPRIELQVISSAEPDRQMRGAGRLLGVTTSTLNGVLGLGAAAASTAASLASRSKTATIVDCYVLPTKQNIVTFAGRIENVSDGDGAAETVGHAIVSAILR